MLRIYRSFLPPVSTGEADRFRLESQADRIYEAAHLAVVTLLTDQNLDYETCENYLEDENCGYGANNDGLLFVIDFGDDSVTLLPNGSASAFFDEDTCDELRDTFKTAYEESGFLYDGLNAFYTACADHLGGTVMAAGIKIRKGRPGIRFSDKALKSAELQSRGSRRPRRAGRWAELRQGCHSRRNRQTHKPRVPARKGNTRRHVRHLPEGTVLYISHSVAKSATKGAFAIHEAVVGPVRRLDKGMINVGIKNLFWSGWRKKSSRRHFSQYVDIF